MKNIFRENLFDKAVEEMKASADPIFIFGGAHLADKISVFLSEHGVKISGFLINKKYWTSECKEKNGYSIHSFEDYLKNHRCMLVVGFAGYTPDFIEPYKNNISKIFVLDFIGKLVLEGLDGTISEKFLMDNSNRIKWLENQLCDELSVKSLYDYIEQRATGIYSKKYENDQYFPADIVHFGEREVFVDCGAYHGETSMDFIEKLRLQNIDSYQSIIVVEADTENAKTAEKSLEGLPNVEIISAGVWSETTMLYMNSGQGDNSQISNEGTECIEVKALDDILKGEEATYIKLDVEGSEMEALRGMRNTIIKYKPRLAVCIYHKVEDFIEIPEYIFNLRKDYKFYVRNHSPYGIETVLYAI